METAAIEEAVQEAAESPTRLEGMETHTTCKRWTVYKRVSDPP